MTRQSPARFAGMIAGAAVSAVVFLGSGCFETTPESVDGQHGTTAPRDGNQQSNRMGRDGHPAVGVEPPELVAADWLNIDTPQTLAGLRGNVVLVEFWATWCGPCVSGIPHMNELHANFHDQGLRIVSFTDEDRKKVEKFQKRHSPAIEYPIGIGSSLSKTYGVNGIPHAFLVGRDGKLRWHGHPADPACERQIAAALREKS